MPTKKDIKIILRKNRTKPPKKIRIKIPNPVNLKSFIPLVIILVLVVFLGYKLISNIRDKKVPDSSSIISAGIEDIKNGNLVEATKKFEEILKKDSNNKEALYNLASIKYIRKEYDGAIADFEDIAKKNPQDGNPYNIMGNILRDKKDYDQAIGKYREAIKIDSSFIQAYIGLADVMSIMGNQDGAKKIIEEGLLKNPDNERLLKFEKIYE